MKFVPWIRKFSLLVVTEENFFFVDGLTNDHKDEIVEIERHSASASEMFQQKVVHSCDSLQSAEMQFLFGAKKFRKFIDFSFAPSHKKKL